MRNQCLCLNHPSMVIYLSTIVGHAMSCLCPFQGSSKAPELSQERGKSLFCCYHHTRETEPLTEHHNPTQGNTGLAMESWDRAPNQALSTDLSRLLCLIPHKDFEALRKILNSYEPPTFQLYKWGSSKSNNSASFSNLKTVIYNFSVRKH